MIRVRSLLFCCLFVICGVQGVRADEPQQTGIEGNYYGVLNNRFQTERFLIRIFRNAEGQLDLRLDDLDQDAKSMKDVKMDTLSVNSDGLSFYHKKLHTGFQGKFITKNRVIIGTWTHNDEPPMHWPVSFARYDDENFPDKTGAERGYARGRLPKEGTFEGAAGGAKVKLTFDKCSSSFAGTVENPTAQKISQFQLVIHLSGAVELRLAAPVALEPGQKAEVKIPAEGHTFVWWTVQATVDKVSGMPGASAKKPGELGEHRHDH